VTTSLTTRQHSWLCSMTPRQATSGLGPAHSHATATGSIQGLLCAFVEIQQLYLHPCACVLVVSAQSGCGALCWACLQTAQYDTLTPCTSACTVPCCVATMQVDNGAVLIPAGVYRITKTLDTRKNIVFRGVGKSLTTLYFPLSLTQVYGNTWAEVRLGRPRCHSILYSGSCTVCMITGVSHSCCLAAGAWDEALSPAHCTVRHAQGNVSQERLQPLEAALGFGTGCSLACGCDQCLPAVLHANTPPSSLGGVSPC
jgi:hypothetical protein